MKPICEDFNKKIKKLELANRDSYRMDISFRVIN